MGWIHAQEGRKDKARQLLDQLQEKYPKAYYQKAIIHTALSEQVEAMGNLIEAFESGSQIYDNRSYDFDYAFRPLWEYQPFVEKFVKPKG